MRRNSFSIEWYTFVDTYIVLLCLHGVLTKWPNHSPQNLQSVLQCENHLSNERYHTKAIKFKK